MTTQPSILDLVCNINSTKTATTATKTPLTRPRAPTNELYVFLFVPNFIACARFTVSLTSKAQSTQPQPPQSPHPKTEKTETIITLSPSPPTHRPFAVPSPLLACFLIESLMLSDNVVQECVTSFTSALVLGRMNVMLVFTDHVVYA